MLNIPLIEVDAQCKIIELQEKYKGIKKDFNKLEEIDDIEDKNLLNLFDEYKRVKYKLKENYSILLNIIEEFNNNLEYDDSQISYSTKTKKEITDVLKKIDIDKFKQKKKNYNKLIEKIDQRMGKYLKYIDECKKNEENVEIESGFKMLEISNNKELLKKRTQDLLEIKNVSAQVAQMSTDMSLKINEQGKKLDTIETNIDTTEVNTNKAYKEALETEIIIRKSKTKLYILGICIIVLIVLIIFIMTRIFN